MSNAITGFQAALSDLPTIASVGSPIEHAIQLLANYGFFQVVLPFLLVYAIFFAILDKGTGLITPNKNLNGIISFVAAFLIVTATPVVEAINILIPHATYVIIFMLMLLMSLSFFNIDFGKLATDSTTFKWIMVGLIFFIFLGLAEISIGLQIPIIHQIMLLLIGRGDEIGGGELSPALIDSIISIIVVVGLPLIVIYFITGSSDDKK